MHKDPFIFIYFEQTKVLVPKTNTMLPLGTEVTFIPLAALVNNRFWPA